MELEVKEVVEGEEEEEEEAEEEASSSIFSNNLALRVYCEKSFVFSS